MKNVAALFFLLCHLLVLFNLDYARQKWKAILFGVKRLTCEAAKNGCGNQLIVTPNIEGGQMSLNR
jgi:hypothetical protein